MISLESRAKRLLTDPVDDEKCSLDMFSRVGNSDAGAELQRVNKNEHVAWRRQCAVAS